MAQLTQRVVELIAGRIQNTLPQQTEEIKTTQPGSIKPTLGEWYMQLCCPTMTAEYYAMAVDNSRRRADSSSAGQQLLASRLEGFARAGLLALKLAYFADQGAEEEIKLLVRCQGLVGLSDAEIVSPLQTDDSIPIYHKYEGSSSEKKMINLVIAALVEALGIHSSPPVRPAAETRCALKIAATLLDVYIQPAGLYWANPHATALVRHNTIRLIYLT